jgi:hypothetical protein
MLMAFTELELLHQVAQQDQQALLTLYQQYGNLVYSLSLRVLRQPAMAQALAPAGPLEPLTWPVQQLVAHYYTQRRHRPPAQRGSSGARLLGTI